MSSIGSVVQAFPSASADGRAPRGPADANASAPVTDARQGDSQTPDNKGTATPAQVKAAVDAANQELDQSNRELAFVFDDKLGRMLVKIVDTRTNTVIRQVPSEDMLAAARALSNSTTRGALLRSKA